MRPSCDQVPVNTRKINRKRYPLSFRKDKAIHQQWLPVLITFNQFYRYPNRVRALTNDDLPVAVKNGRANARLDRPIFLVTSTSLTVNDELLTVTKHNTASWLHESPLPPHTKGAFLFIIMRAASMIFVLSSAVELARETRAFSPVASRAREVVHSATFLSAKKGFGSAPDPSKKKSGSTTAQQDSTSYPASSSSSISKDDENPARSAIATSTRSPQQRPNAGQRALEDMRRQQAEKKDAELRKVRELLDADQQVQEAAAAIPERVAQRMGARMLPFVGLPFFLGMGVFVGFWYMATYRNLEYQPALVAASTIVVLLLGLVVRSILRSLSVCFEYSS